MEVKTAWDNCIFKSTEELIELPFSVSKISLQYKLPIPPSPSPLPLSPLLSPILK
jgi:hypothetical protein